MEETRSYALNQIMQIDHQVLKTARSKRYILIQKYVQRLKNLSGDAIIEIEDPHNMGKIIKIRKNSQTAKDYLKAYEILLNEYQVLFKELQKRKTHYKDRLFS